MHFSYLVQNIQSEMNELKSRLEDAIELRLEEFEKEVTTTVCAHEEAWGVDDTQVWADGRDHAFEELVKAFRSKAIDQDFFEDLHYSKHGKDLIGFLVQAGVKPYEFSHKYKEEDL